METKQGNRQSPRACLTALAAWVSIGSPVRIHIDGPCKPSIIGMSSSIPCRTPPMTSQRRWQQLVSCLSLVAFLIANAPRRMSLSDQPVSETAKAARSHCCACCDAVDDNTDAPCCCCCQALQANDPALIDADAAANEPREPSCPCCPWCPTGCCHGCQVKSPCCLAAWVSSPGLPPCLERLATEPALLIPPGACDDLMHPPRA
jgi:hypothetical protein